MRTRILKALLGLCALALVAYAAVAVRIILRQGESSVESDLALGAEAIEVSKRALEATVRTSLERLAIDQAALLDEELAAVEDQGSVLAAALVEIVENPAALAFARSYGPGQTPPDPSRTSVLYRSPSATGAPRLPPRADLLFAPVIDGNSSVFQIKFATPDGWARMYPYQSDIPKGYETRDRPWYTMIDESRASSWTDTYVGKLSGILEMTYGLPVKSRRGDFVGVLALITSLQRFTEVVLDSELGGLAKAVLVNRKLEILAHSKALPLGSTKGEHRPFQLDDPQTHAALARAVGEARAGGVLATRLGGKDVLVAQAPSRHGQSVLLVADAAAMMAPVTQVEESLRQRVLKYEKREADALLETLSRFAAASAVLLLVVWWLARRLARGITEPVLALDRAARLMGEGSLEEQVELHTGDELERLGNTLNAMAQNLKQHIAELRSTTQQRERIESELRVAREIQASLMPGNLSPFPSRTEFELYATMIPAREVGGDFYDCFYIDEEHLCFLVGDVADKGIPAALYMTVAKSLLQAEVRGTTEPDEILTRVNRILAAENDKCMFVTVICAVLEIRTGALRIASAGHGAPVHVAQGNPPRLIELPRGLVIGPLAEANYRSDSARLDPGDVLLLYSDGVTEAMDPGGALYGEERMVACLAKQHAEESAVEIVHRIQADVAKFARGAEQSDDITIMALRYYGAAGKPARDAEAEALRRRKTLRPGLRLDDVT